MNIILLQEMKSSAPQEKPIPAGTRMVRYFTRLSWSCFRDEKGNILVLHRDDLTGCRNIQIVGTEVA